MKKALFIGVAALLLAGCARTTTVTPDANPGPSDQVVPTMTATPGVGMQGIEESNSEPWTITLSEQNDSGQTGVATLEEETGKVVVTLDIDSPSSVAQPAHIHVGSCPTPGAVKFPLTDVQGGKSVTTVDTTIAALKAMGPLAINVHKSAAESKVYTSCGDLK